MFKVEDSITNNRRLYVIWLNPVETTDLATHDFDVDTVTLHNIYGSTVEITDADNEDGRVTVQFSGQPVYVETER